MKYSLVSVGIIFLLCKAAFAAPAFVQGNAVDGSSTLAFSSDVSANSLLVATVRCGANSIMSVSDSRNGSYSSGFSFYDGTTGDTLGIFYYPNSASGSDTVTVASCGGSIRFTISVYSGMALSSVLDQVNSGTGTGVISCTTANITTTQDSELLYCGGEQGNSANWTTQSPFTNREQTTKTESGDNIISSIGTYSCTTFGVANDNCQNAIIGFKALAASSQPNVPRRILFTTDD